MDKLEQAENVLVSKLVHNNQNVQNRVRELCCKILSFNFSYAQSLTDMLCSQDSTKYSELRHLFMAYCCMCICMPSENFMATLFNLNEEEEESFSLACRSVVHKLLNIVYLELIQKKTVKNTSSHFMAWCTCICYPSWTYITKFGFQNFHAA